MNADPTPGPARPVAAPDADGTLVVPLDLIARPDPEHPAPPAVRLRSALKLLLRGYGIRCRWHQDAPANQEAAPAVKSSDGS